MNFALDAEQRADARRALALIEGRGLTLEGCVRLALQLPAGGDGMLRAVPLPSAIGHFIEATRERGRRERTLGYYEESLGPLERDNRGMQTTGLTPDVCRAFVGGSAARWRALRAFLRWCLRQDPPLVARALLDKVQGPAAVASGEPAYLTVPDCKAILTGAPETAPAAALCLFAGLRPWEACRIEWAAIDAKAKTIRISAAVSKTGRARVLEDLPPTVWRWLRGGGEGRVCQLRPDEFTRRVRAAGGFKQSRPWPHDGLRHTFATYHVAAYQDPGRTSLILGHAGDQQLLYRHYRGLAPKAEALKFWRL